MTGLWIGLAIVAAAAIAYGLWRRGASGGGGGSSRERQAARARRELVSRVNDEDVADRLAEGERKRDPGADMLTCYRRALQRLDRDRRR
ncbi:MAG: hypothetical protein ACOCUS_04275 [Polyangiales bacterium]